MNLLKQFDVTDESLVREQVNIMEQRRETAPAAAETTRTCRLCRETKAIDEFHKPWRTFKSTICNTCKDENKKGLVEVVAYAEKERTCKICMASKPLEEFHKVTYYRRKVHTVYRGHTCTICLNKRSKKNKDKNKDRKKRQNSYHSRRRKYDEAFRTRMDMYSNLRAAVKGKRYARSSKLTGCPGEALKGWIESQFEDGMTWENIHIDHMIPCKEFNFNNEEERRQCFHFTNLQPLFAQDNLRKSATIVHDMKWDGNEWLIRCGNGLYRKRTIRKINTAINT